MGTIIGMANKNIHPADPAPAPFIKAAVKEMTASGAMSKADLEMDRRLLELRKALRAKDAAIAEASEIDSQTDQAPVPPGVISDSTGKPRV